MSEPASTPAPATSAPTADVTPPDNAGRQTLKRTDPTRAERMARAMAVAKGQPLPPAKAPAAAPEPVQAPPAPVDAAPAEPAAATPTEAPKPTTAEPAPAQSAAALALAKAQKAALQREREAYEAKQKLKEYEAKLKAAEEQQAKYQKLNPVELLQERGYTYEQVTKDLVDKKYEPKTAEQIALEKYEAQLKAQEERISAFEKEREENRKREIRAQESAYVAEQLKAAAERFPLLNAVKWAPDQALDAFYKHYQETGVQPDLEDVFSKLESAIAADAEPIFASDAYLKRLLADEKQRDRVLSMLGIKQSQPAQQAPQRAQAAANSPAAIPQAKAADPGTRKTASKTITPAQRRAAAVAAIKAKRGE